MTSRQLCRVYRSSTTSGSLRITPRACSSHASARLTWLVARAEASTSSPSARSWPANAPSPAASAPQRSPSVVPGSRPAVAIAPGLTIGFVRPSGARSTASMALNGRPVALAPTTRRTSSAPIASQASASTNGFATLMSGNATSASPTTWTSPWTFATAMPNRSGSTAWSAGYTDEGAPSRTER